MSAGPLRYLSAVALQDLLEDKCQNLKRYATGDFHDLRQANGWEIEAKGVTLDTDALAAINRVKVAPTKKAASDLEASRIVYGALKGMTTALACEERVWVRLTHVECLEYARNRWLHGKDPESLNKAVEKHMFARGRTGIRDDNALSRLWWNAHIARLVDPDDCKGALELILKTADIRQGLVERPGIASRPPLMQAIIRAMRKDEARTHKRITFPEKAFREFMKAVNRDGSGILFEVFDDNTCVDALMEACAERAAKLCSASRRASP